MDDRTREYSLSGSFTEFLGEHLQLGIGPGYTRSDVGGESSDQATAASVVANYVFGGDARWRGYVGVYGSLGLESHAQNVYGSGAQLGALYFLTPAIAFRTELRHRTVAASGGPATWNDALLVTLDPYVLGDASMAPKPAGLGDVDLALTVYGERTPEFIGSGVSGLVAPFLARWAQVGVEGSYDRESWYDGVSFYQARGFARGYAPVTVRTQPYAEAFVQADNEGGIAGGLKEYGGTLGVRRMLNANAALDIGIRRTAYRAQLLRLTNLAYSFREPGNTALVVGILTHVGRPR